MLRTFRFLLLSAALIAAAGGVRAADSSADASDPAEPLPPELQAELDALLHGTWHPSATIRASAGWRDNILLSPFAPIERVFGRAELEAILLRPMRASWEFVSFLNADVLRYVSPPSETSGEEEIALHGEARWQPIAPVRLALKATGYVRDMVIDLSETEATRVVAPTRVRGGFATFAPRLRLPAGFTIEPFGQVRRTDYREFAGDYDETRAGGRLEWSRHRALSLSVALSEHHRRYAERAQFTAGGRPIDDTRLRFRQREGELKARGEWDAAGEWTIAASVGRLENRDEASGYFDYDQERARLEIEWRRGAWRAMLDAEARRLEYLVQTVGIGIAPPPRIADDYDVLLRVERELDERWSVFAEHAWERSRSNELEFSYRANTVFAGVQRSF